MRNGARPPAGQMARLPVPPGLAWALERRSRRRLGFRRLRRWAVRVRAGARQAARLPAPPGLGSAPGRTPRGWGPQRNRLTLPRARAPARGQNPGWAQNVLCTRP